jgi:uncharacterized protein (TIGR02301 family)
MGKGARTDCSRHRVLLAASTLVLGCSCCLPMRPAHAAEPPQQSSDARPYDDKLMRLSEVIGAVHYLRELCGANDGQIWRDRMRELIDAEKGSALRKVRLTKSFNHGYRSHRRTYQSCSQPAQTTLARFLVEGSELSEAIVRETQ